MEEDNQQQNNLTSHEKKEMKKQERDEEKEKTSNKLKSKLLKGKTLKYSIITLVVILVLVGGYYFIVKPIKSFQPYYGGSYHWHANFELFACGQPVEVKCPGSICGPMNLHHHNDNIIHMEGNSIAKKEDLALGKFFDAIGIPFSEAQISNWKNGDICPNGEPGEIHLY